MSSKDEYFAQGVQSWFEVIAYANQANDVHKYVNTKEKLRSYDYELYKLVAQVFPCGNTFIKRCEKSRAREAAQKLLMDCNEGDGEREEGGDDGGDDDRNPDPEPSPDNCEDKNGNCPSWRDAGYCQGAHQEYMSQNCRKSCGLCGDADSTPSCDDEHMNCREWATEGYCTDSNNVEWMSKNCKKSCNRC